MRAAGVEAGGRVEDDRSRVLVGGCPRVIDRSFAPGLRQGDLKPQVQVIGLHVLNSIPLALVVALEVSRYHDYTARSIDIS
jgi:hypothetical protein